MIFPCPSAAPAQSYSSLKGPTPTPNLPGPRSLLEFSVTCIAEVSTLPNHQIELLLLNPLAAPDFRASPAHLNHPCMIGKKIDLCYLDTTYLDPKYCFPAQELVIEACAELVRTRVIGGDKDAFRSTGGKEQKEGETAMKGWLAKIEDVKEEVKQEMVIEVVDDPDDKLADGKGKGKEKEKKPERLLVVVGTYSIGKERCVVVSLLCSRLC